MKRYYILALLLLALVGAVGSISTLSAQAVTQDPAISGAISQPVEIIEPGMGSCSAWEPIISYWPMEHIVGWEYHPDWYLYCSTPTRTLVRDTPYAYNDTPGGADPSYWYYYTFCNNGYSLCRWKCWPDGCVFDGYA